MKHPRTGRIPALRYRCVIFDLDGTLLDTRAAMGAAIDAVLARHGLPAATPQRLDETLHQGLPAMLRASLADRSVAETELAALCTQVEAQYLGPSNAGIVPFAHAEKLLWRLHANGAWLAICSNQSEKAVRFLLDRFDLTGCFREIVGGDTLSVRKPHPRTLQWLMACANAKPSDCLLVGDSEVDRETAANAGVDGVLLKHGYGSTEARRAGTWLEDLASVERFLYLREPLTKPMDAAGNP